MLQTVWRWRRRAGEDERMHRGTMPRLCPDVETALLPSARVGARVRRDSITNTRRAIAAPGQRSGGRPQRRKQRMESHDARMHAPARVQPNGTASCLRSPRPSIITGNLLHKLHCIECTHGRISRDVGETANQTAAACSRRCDDPSASEEFTALTRLDTLPVCFAEDSFCRCCCCGNAAKTLRPAAAAASMAGPRVSRTSTGNDSS